LCGFLIVGEPLGTKPPPPEKDEFEGIPVLKTGEPPPGYHLVWADEFDGAELNPKDWIHRTGLRYWSVQQPQNVAVHDGNLWLACRKEAVGNSSYTAGGVISKRVFRYGYFESRFKVPPTKGWHTSFWLMHNAEANRDAHAGSRQEIDICDNDSSRLTCYGANLHQWAPEHRGLGQRMIRTPDESAVFHLWACEFTPERVVYYFDGRPVLLNDVTKLPDHGDMSVWLTTIAAPLGATSAVDENRLPVYAVYDYVRVYEKK
jgi:beta-glucanase (GH16 family)